MIRRAGVLSFKDSEQVLLRHHPPRQRDSTGGRHWRNRERQPGIPARRPVGRIEFAVSFQVEIALHVSDREQESDLRTDADDARLESTQDRALSEVVGDLLVSISHKADKDLLGEKLGRTPVEMEIDAALVLRVRVLEIVGKSGNRRKFVPRLRIEIGVAAAIDGAVTDAEVGEAGGILGANGNVSRHVGHEVVDARVPLQARQRIQVAERGDRVTDASHAGCRKWSEPRCQRPVEVGAGPPEQAG